MFVPILNKMFIFPNYSDVSTGVFDGVCACVCVCGGGGGVKLQ